MQIKAENLTYIYSEKSKSLAVTALDRISLEIFEGDFFGIIGKTGSGKSTFIQHLNGIIKVGKDKGKLIVGDFNLADKNCDYKALRSKVGMVFQYPEYQLFAETVFDEVAFGIKNFKKDLTSEQIELYVKEALAMVGLDYESVKDRSPFDFSGGQKRRIAIAGVIVSKPEILVLDEPCAGLDPKGKKGLIDLLKRLHNSFVKTIIIVSHDMDLVAENCNRVAVFDSGRLAKIGSAKEVFSDYEFIKNASLDLPVTAYLNKKLKEIGIVLDNDLTVKDFVRSVKEYKAKKMNKGGNEA